jgi:hypothetical protein
MNSGEHHKNKNEENEDFIYDINNNRSNLFYNNINNINENTTLYTTKKRNPEQKIFPEQETNLSKGKSTKKIKKIKFKYRPIKTGLYFSIQKRSKKGRNRMKTLYFRQSRHGVKNCDNILRKIKSWVISDIIKFINQKLKEANKNRKKNKLRLYTILKDQSYNTNINYNRALLGKKMDAVLSDNVSEKTKIKSLYYNKNIINKIKNENYDNIIKILNLTFLECINHYIEKETIDCLEGFEEEFKLKKERISKYEDRFLGFVNNIEKYLTDKNFRKEMNNTQTIAITKSK